VTTGATVGLIHHVQGFPPTYRCVLTCEQDDVLKNSRLLDLSTGVMGATGMPVGPDGGACPTLTSLPAIGRNDPRAMRNPMMSFIMVPPPCGKASVPDAHTFLTRDMQWRFQVRGVFTPLSISLTQGGTGGVSPQSMKFIEPFGQIAVVDAEQQGLVLIDLNTLSFAHTPYF
jgi:hypothetical protein